MNFILQNREKAIKKAGTPAPISTITLLGKK